MAEWRDTTMATTNRLLWCIFLVLVLIAFLLGLLVVFSA
jgi:hypothetical protein